MPKLFAYEATLSNPQNVVRVQAARAQIERVGGRVVIAPPTTSGMIIVTLLLPPEYSPAQFLSDLPFYPI
jgi:hypothetical protein